MVDVQELVVRAVPEGVDDTVSELGDMSEQVEESTDSMENQAAAMGGLAEKFQGAMDVAVAGLALAAGFLLSQVPVLGEAFDGLFAIVSAVAFQMDKVLRPVLGPVTDGLLTAADILFQAEGAGGALIGTLGTLVTIFGAVVAPAAALASKLGVAASTGSALISAGSTLAGVITTVGAAIISLPGLIAVGIAALAGFIAAYLTNWNGARDKTDAIIGDILGFVSSGFDRLVTVADNLLGNLVSAVKSKGANAVKATSDFVNNMAGEFRDLISNAADWGRQLISRLIAGIKSAAGNLQSAVSGINLTAGVTIGDVAGTVSAGAQAAESGASDFIGSVGSGRGTINLDGRSVENTQGRYRADNLHRRGG